MPVAFGVGMVVVEHGFQHSLIIPMSVHPPISYRYKARKRFSLFVDLIHQQGDPFPSFALTLAFENLLCCPIVS